MLRPKFHGEIAVLDSALIKAVKYDPITCVLDVKLISGQAYRYRHIIAHDFAALITSKSTGKIYNDFIKKDIWGMKRRATRLRTW